MLARDGANPMADPAPRQLHPHVHWPPALAQIATGLAYALITDDLRLGPTWLLRNAALLWLSNVVVFAL